MTATTVNGITIEYETAGDPTNPPMLLVMGFSAQLVYWPPDLVAGLAERGFFVIIYDNRDVGLSSQIEPEAAGPGVAGAGLDSGMLPPYTLDDMADDGIGLLAALGIQAAHIVGASMGGFIAQLMAINHPDRVRSLCSVMSTTGDPAVPPPTAETIGAIMGPTPRSRDEAIELSLLLTGVIGSPGFPVDEEWIRARAARSWDRGNYPAGMLRHALAVAAGSDRTEALRHVNVPTLVIHGSDDPLISPIGGQRTADAVPGAQLVLIPGMGHDLPRGAWPTIIGAVESNARRALPSGD